MNQRIEMQSCFVIHSLAYRDTSLLVELFTRNHGRVKVVARSARGLNSRFRGKLQAFTPLLASWQGKGDLMTLTQLENAGAAFELAGSNLLSGFYLHELIQRLIGFYDPHPEIFELYVETLAELTKMASAEPALRYFEKYLLQNLGYGLQLNQVAVTNVPIEPEAEYIFVPEQGFIPLTPDHNQMTYRGKELLAISGDDFSDESTLQTAKHLMRQALVPILGSKPIKSRELFYKAEKL